MNDALQGMLFGTITDDEAENEDPTGELRICALNVNSPSLDRAQRLVTWLVKTRCNTLVLTEMQPSDGGLHILACLTAEGFTTTCAPGWQDSRYFAAIATRYVATTPVRPAGFDPRIVAVDLATGDLAARLVGVYSLTNGMTAESSQRRRVFQHRLLDYLAQVAGPGLCIAGDLNVVEPDHRPHLPAFEQHDYAFYTGMLSLGLRDAYRELNPLGQDHSWTSPRLGGQRLDHCLVGAAAGTIRTCTYDYTTQQENLSDHAALLTVIGPRETKAVTQR